VTAPETMRTAVYEIPRSYHFWVVWPVSGLTDITGEPSHVETTQWHVTGWQQLLQSVHRCGGSTVLP